MLENRSAVDCLQTVGGAVHASGCLPNGDATEAISRLGGLQDAKLLELRSLKRAESLIDALLAPCIASAVEQDYTPPDESMGSFAYHHPINGRTRLDFARNPQSNVVREANENVLVGDEVERELIELDYQDGLQLDKEYRATKRSKRRLPCNEMPLDTREDCLSWERFNFELSYPTRLAQANRRYSGTLAQWSNYCARNGLDDSTNEVEPSHDTAQEMLADLWQHQWSNVMLGYSCKSNSTWHLRMSYPRQFHAPAQPEQLPHGLVELLTPVESKILALIVADASERDIARQTGCYRENIPRIVDSIRAKALEWALTLN